MRLAAALPLILAFFMLAGALGLRSPDECESDPAIIRNSQKMQCYFSAALTAAYLCAPGQMCSAATSLCEEVWVRFGAPVDPDTGSDIRKKAELMSNQCYFEVARITRNPDTCGYITQRDDFGSQLFGDAVTRETCYDEAARLAQLAPENYYRSNPNNICAIVFVLPLFVMAAAIGSTRVPRKS
ncbi:hypothetical protein L0Y65_06695 [Candidatus Micrarchaeota archaeon]|nr:hypothetical protein [Candidatus Micrarchaeota archaeon]